MQSGNLAGKYRLLATLGHGGMADVYLAAAPGPAGYGELVVVKELRPALAQDPDFLDMFLDEARLVAKLSHPNVVHSYETLGEGGRYFIAMEYLDGQPLNRILAKFAKREGLPWGTGLRIVSEALRGLHHAHELRDESGELLEVVHRDITPHNLFVTYDGQVKLVDFGIAKALDSQAETRVGMLKGKVGYMAPEQSRGDPVDRRTDVYGMGVVLWELLARRRMWRATPDVVILSRLANDDIPRLGSVASGIPPALVRLCDRATAADPAARFASAEAFRLAVEACLSALDEPSDLAGLGALISETFADERERMRAVIQLQLLDATRLPAVLEHTHTSHSGSLDPRVDSQRLIPATPTPVAVTMAPRSNAQDVDTTVFPHSSEPRRHRKRWLAGLAVAFAASGLLWLVIAARHSVPAPLELSGAIASDTRLSANRRYILKSTIEVKPGVTLTIEPGAGIVADPQRGGALVLRPGARLVTDD